MLIKIKRILKKPYSTLIAPLFFPGTIKYWEKRYASEKNSGEGSYGKFAEYKAEVINRFIAEHHIKTVIEFGCGDGNQLTLAKYPTYLGFDVSSSAIALCRERFRNNTSMQFKILDEYKNETAELSLSLDVIYHLVEDDIFVDYMEKLFSSSNRFVIIYSINSDVFEEKVSHIRVRKFTNWIIQNKPDWILNKYIPNKYPYNHNDGSGSPADFYFFQKIHK